MWVAVQAVDEDDVDKSTTDGCIDLCEAITTDLWSARGCLEKVSSSYRVHYTAEGWRELTIIAIQTTRLKSNDAI